MQYYASKEIGYILKDCPNRDATGGLSPRRVNFVDNKCKGRVNVVKIPNKTRKKVIINFEQFLCNEVNVMAEK